MEIVIAGYVRALSQMPQINRFIANKRFYSRKEITVSFAVLQNMADGSDKENIAKCKFDPGTPSLTWPAASRTPSPRPAWKRRTTPR